MPFEPKPDSRHGYDVRRLIEAGMTVQPNTLWSFTDISELLQRPVIGNDPALQRALHMLSRDHSREFKNVRTVGYIRLSDEGIVGEAGNDRAAVKRRVKRASQRSSNISEWDKLADPLKREVDAHRSILALLRHVIAPRAIKRVRHEVDRIRDELPLAETLRLFRKNTD